jgi:ParB family chromosome partitioning protein
MGKLDELMRSGGTNMAESIGKDVGRGPGSPPLATSSTPARWQGVTKSKGAVEVPVEKLHGDPNQPREEFNEAALGRLAESIRTRGQLQPIRVRWDEGRGAYVIIAGERRWRAARMAGLATISAVVVDGEMSPVELLAIQLVENCLREDLRPVEQARAYRALLEQNDWSIRQLAAELALDHSAVAKTLKLLDLPESVQGFVEKGELPTWTAFEVAKAETPQLQEELARRVVAERLTASETAEAVRESTGHKGRGAAKGRKGRVTTRVIRTTTGPRVTVEFKKGLDDALIVAALEEALSRIRPRIEAELSADDQAAA